MYVRKRLDYTALAWMMSLQVKIKGTQNKVDIVVGAYYWQPTQDNSTDELLYKQLR